MQIISILSLATILITLAVMITFRRQLVQITRQTKIILIVGSVLWMYFMGVRFIPSIVKIAESDSQITFNKKIEIIFFTNLCPFLTLVTPILFAAGKKKAAQSLAPWITIGGILNFLVVIVAPAQVEENLATQIFYSYNGDNAYWMMHYLLVIYGILLLCSTEKCDLGYWLRNSVIVSLYLLYLEIVRVTTGIRVNISGLTAEDWALSQDPNVPDGVYSFVTNFINISFPAIFLVVYCVFAGLNYGIIALNAALIKSDRKRQQKLKTT